MSICDITGSLTIDVEEYFQVEAFAKTVSTDDWQSFESRVEFQTDKILHLLETKNVKATFYILGCIADAHPQLVKKIADMGHEVGSHGQNHQHTTKLTRTEFHDDILHSKNTLEDLIGKPVLGYRAPCFSITEDNDWAHDLVKECGYQYSSSTYPIKHDNYGVPKAPRTPYYLDNGLLEIPVSTLALGAKTIASGGGGFFRLYPYFVYKQMLARSAKQLGFFNFYTHPWEYDKEQPKIEASFKSNFRHYLNQGKTLSRLSRLCDDFSFDSVASLHLNKDYPTLGKWTDIAKGIF